MKIKKESLFLILILVMGILVRVYEFGKIPGGINQDEAFAGYEAFSVLNFGTDSWGYKNPVYFISWGSGMNVLSSYFMMPFVCIFGNTIWAIRIPQLLISVFSMIVFYKLIKKNSRAKSRSFCPVSGGGVPVAHYAFKMGAGVQYGAASSFMRALFFHLRNGKQ